MGLFSRNRNKIVLAVDVQGDHGIKPPAEEIGKEVTSWLDNYVSPKDGLQFELQIECCRIRVGFTGIKVLRVPEFNRRCIEMHIRLHEEPYGWRGYLICPNNEVLSRIMLAERPEAWKFVNRHNKKREEWEESIAETGPTDLVTRRYERVGKQLQKQSSMLKKISKPKNSKQYFYIVNSSIGPDDQVSFELLKNKMSEILGESVDLDLFTDLLSMLVFDGIFEPVCGDTDGMFCPTVLFFEQIEAHKELLREEELEKLERKKDSLAKLRNAAEREYNRLIKKAEEEKEIIIRLEGQITEIKQQINELSREDDLFSEVAQPKL